MSKPELVQDPTFGDYYRAKCDKCGKIFQAVSEKSVLNNLLVHTGIHNGNYPEVSKA